MRYEVTGDPICKEIGTFFMDVFDSSHNLQLLKADDIAGFHVNTHIPVIIGSQMRYEVTGDPIYKEIETFFTDVFNSSHTYATGGVSIHEFRSDPNRLAVTLQTENEESRELKKDLQLLKAPRGGGGGGGGRSGGGGGSRDYLGKGPKPGTWSCFNCGLDGHWARDCKAGDRKNKCYRCGDRGHIKRNCQNSPKKLIRGRSCSRTPSPKRGRCRSYSRSRSYR